MADREITVKVTADFRDFKRALRKVRRCLHGDYDLGVGMVQTSAAIAVAWWVLVAVLHEDVTVWICSGPAAVGAWKMWRNR